MSYCRTDGKDKIIFISQDDHKQPSKVSLPEETEPPRGLVMPDGDINWACPCLGGMATGPCGVEFREAFSCFHYSKEEAKGSECLEKFHTMSDCMGEYPGVYGGEDSEDITMPEDDKDKDTSNTQTSSQEDIDKGITEHLSSSTSKEVSEVNKDDDKRLSLTP